MDFLRTFAHSKRIAENLYYEVASSSHDALYLHELKHLFCSYQSHLYHIVCKQNHQNYIKLQELSILSQEWFPDLNDRITRLVDANDKRKRALIDTYNLAHQVAKMDYKALTS